MSERDLNEERMDCYQFGTVPAQPGQEQRMDALADKLERNLMPSLQDSVQVDILLEACEVLRSSRPTADLGDDGEMVERLQHWAAIVPSPLVCSCMREAADRIEQLRKALDPDTLTNRIWDNLPTIDTASGVGDTMLTYAELKAAISAVLSRTWGIGGYGLSATGQLTSAPRSLCQRQTRARASRQA